MDNAEKGGIIAGGIAAVIGGITIYSATKKKAVKPTVTPPSLSKIELSVNKSTIEVGNIDSFTATAYNNNNEPMPDVSLTLYEITTSTVIGTETTDNNGEAMFTAKFNKKGKYSFEVET
ncbi:MAG: hypothetical protein OWT28_06415 [Firmicutes bacterium]|nr:hypothetical protein [Bacillota bacterium]